MAFTPRENPNMKRRTFARATLASLCAAGAGIQTAFAARPAEARLAGGEIYELRTYTLKSGNLQALDAYLAKALLPALKRQRLGPVGVFTESEKTIREHPDREKSGCSPGKRNGSGGGVDPPWFARIGA